jgi:hypothetical protein
MAIWRRRESSLQRGRVVHESRPSRSDGKRPRGSKTQQMWKVDIMDIEKAAKPSVMLVA